MKNILKTIVVALILFAATKTNAQGSDQCTINIVILEIYSLTVNPAQSSVSININTVDHLQNGNNSDNLNHLNIVASGAYQVEAKALTNIVGAEGSIDVTHLELNIGDNGGSDFLSDFPLSLSDQLLIDSNTGSLNRNLDINYFLDGGEWLVDLPAGTYTTTLQYTLTLD